MFIANFKDPLLCYNEEKGLYITEADKAKKNEIFIKPSGKTGFYGNKYNLKELLIEIITNTGYGMASYFTVGFKYKNKYILNFTKEYRAVNFGAPHDDSVHFFSFNPNTKTSWLSLFELIIEIYNNGSIKTSMGDIEKYLNDLNEYLKKYDFATEFYQKDSLLNMFTLSRVKKYYDFITNWNEFVSEETKYEHRISYANFIEGNVSYLSKIYKYVLKHDNAYEEKYRELRLLSHEVFKLRPAAKEHLQGLDIRYIDYFNPLSLNWIYGTEIVYTKFKIYSRLLGISDKELESAFPNSNLMEEKWIFIDNKANKILELDDSEKSNCFSIMLPSKNQSNNIFTLSSDKEIYLIAKLTDNSLKQIRLEKKYNEIGGFNYGIAVVKYGSTYGIIDSKGREIIPTQYSYISNVYNEISNTIRIETEEGTVQENIEDILSLCSKDLYNESDYVINHKNNKENFVPLHTPINGLDCKNFKRFEKIDNLSISQVNYIVGANNAGKSTFIELIELLMHDIQKLERGFSSFNEFIAYKIGEKNEKNIWGMQGHNEIEIGGKDKITCHFDFNPYIKYINSKHIGKNFDISMQIGNIKFNFSLNSDEKQSFIEIESLINSNYGFRISGKRMISLTNVNEYDKEKYMVSLDKYDWQSIESTLKDLLSKQTNGKKIQSKEDTNITNTSDFESFLQELYSSFVAATEVVHIGVWKGNINLPYCMEYFEGYTSKDGNSRDAIRNFVKHYRLYVSKDIIDKTTMDIIKARDNIVIPFINKWLHLMEIGEGFSMSKESSNPKIQCEITYSKEERFLEPEAYNKIYSYMSNIADDICLFMPETKTYDQKPEIQTIYISDKSGNKEDIRSKGTGAQHFVSLLFTISRLMLNNILRDQTLPVILVEEPEQNLHPKLQSLLADFFWDVTRVQKKILKEYGISKNISDCNLQILVETHSEYLIRSSQGYVKAYYTMFGDLKDNPFRTFYFPQEGMPYDLEYTESGRFKREIGTGFFDEAARLSFNISSL